MKNLKIFIIILALQFYVSKVNASTIFSCEPEWASLVEEIAKDKAKIFIATTAFQDAHYIQAKPSLIANMRKSELVICSGAELEVGWLPILLQKAGKSSVQMGGNASIMAAKYVNTIEIPTRVDRSDGDVHPEGNPHIHLNPYNIAILADVVLEKLIYLDPNNKSYYIENHKNFKKKWNEQIKVWERKASGLKNKKVITQHKNFSYLLDWLEIENIATMEPKPGVPPTSKHLAELVEIAKEEKVYLILRTPFEENRSTKWLSGKTNIKSVELPYTVGGNKHSNNLFELFDNSINLLIDEVK